MATRRVLTAEQKGLIIRLRSEGRHLGEISRHPSIRAKRARVVEHLADVRANLIDQGKQAEADALYKPRSARPKQSASRAVNAKTPPRVALFRDIIAEGDPASLVDMLKRPVDPKGKSLSWLIDGIRSGGVTAITYQQAADLIGCGKQQLERASRSRAAGDRFRLKTIKFEGHDRIDARDFMSRFYDTHQKLVDKLTANNVFRLRYGTSSKSLVMPLRNALKTDTILKTQAMPVEGFLELLRDYDRRLGTATGKQRLLTAVEKDPESGALMRTRLETITNNLRRNLSQGRFLVSEMRLRRLDSRDEAKGEVPRAPGGKYRFTKSGETPYAIREQNRAALKFLDIADEDLERRMALNDRVLIGKAIAESNGAVPLHLPKAEKAERQRAYGTLSDALIATKSPSPVVKRIANELAMRAAKSMGKPELWDKVLPLIKRTDQRLIEAFDRHPAVYPMLYAEVLTRRNGAAVNLRDIVDKTSRSDLRYIMFSHLVDKAADKLNGQVSGGKLPRRFLAYADKKADELGIDRAFVDGLLNGISRNGSRPTAANPPSQLSPARSEMIKRALERAEARR